MHICEWNSKVLGKSAIKRGFSLQEAVQFNKFPGHYEGPCEGEREGAGQLVGNRDGRELD